MSVPNIAVQNWTQYNFEDGDTNEVIIKQNGFNDSLALFQTSINNMIAALNNDVAFVNQAREELNADNIVHAPGSGLPNEAGAAYSRGVVGAGDLYARGGILGTVSRSGGVPTGAIIERGSNANGEYVKFADGTLLLSASVTPDWETAALQTFSFPASPVSGSTNVRGGVAGMNSGSGNIKPRFSSIEAHGVTDTFWILYLYGTATNGTGSEGFISFYAVGRWF